ncbi:RAP domain-containing protein [Besnoitia besnoiti]|uniref:RAP domain-containing protein n=1 Tax=Besnoitia besnoiti TaxID=94643 RepID=A0A2A9M9Q0_BESBE|nr:RAP domain-containing protein [Besnoitia besnoiti]PFH35208.1 RAP domain-containing protein [Besnoitia besnoiti]
MPARRFFRFAVRQEAQWTSRARAYGTGRQKTTPPVPPPELREAAAACRQPASRIRARAPREANSERGQRRCGAGGAGARPAKRKAGAEDSIRRVRLSDCASETRLRPQNAFRPERSSQGTCSTVSPPFQGVCLLNSLRLFGSNSLRLLAQVSEGRRAPSRALWMPTARAPARGSLRREQPAPPSPPSVAADFAATCESLPFSLALRRRFSSRPSSSDGSAPSAPESLQPSDKCRHLRLRPSSAGQGSRAGGFSDLQQLFAATYIHPDDDACHASAKRATRKRRRGSRNAEAASSEAGSSTSPSTSTSLVMQNESASPSSLPQSSLETSFPLDVSPSLPGWRNSPGAPSDASFASATQRETPSSSARASLQGFSAASGGDQRSTDIPSSALADVSAADPSSLRFPSLPHPRPSPLRPPSALRACSRSGASAVLSASLSSGAPPPASSQQPPREAAEEDLDDSDPVAWLLSSSAVASTDVAAPSKPTPPRLSRRRTLARAAASSLSRERNSWMSQPQVLIKMLFKASQNNVRDANLWKVFVQRVALTAIHMNADQLALTLYAFARVRYFDARLLHTLAPFILKLLDAFSPQGLSLVLNAFKKLRVHKYDTIELIVNQLCLEIHRCGAQDLALAANSLAFFYVYHAKFWKLLLKHLPRVGPKLLPQHAAVIVAAFARIDLRDGSALLLLSRILKKKSLALDQAQLAVAISAFSKLDFTHPKLTISFHKAVHHLFAQDPDPFDSQALCLLLHSTVCLTGGSEQLIRKLLLALVRKSPSLAVHQTRKLRHTATVLQAHHPDLYDQLDENVRRFLADVREASPKELGDHGSRWAIEVASVLQEMGISFQRRLYISGCRVDILLPEKKIIIMCAGPHHFYLDSTRRTAYSRLQQRLLELQGYSVCVLPYYEWSELQSPEEKQRFLWTFGRRAAAEIQALHAEECSDGGDETDDHAAYANSFLEDPVELAVAAEEAFDADGDSDSDGDRPPDLFEEVKTNFSQDVPKGRRRGRGAAHS